jgi:hypothetical protein
VALRICNFPHCGRYLVCSDWHSCGWGHLPGESRESLQVGSIERPGFHQPVREESTGEVVSTKDKSRADQCQKRKQSGFSDRKDY